MPYDIKGIATQTLGREPTENELTQMNQFITDFPTAFDNTAVGVSNIQNKIKEYATVSSVSAQKKTDQNISTLNNLTGGLTEEQAKAKYGTDFTGVQQDQKTGLYSKPEVSSERKNEAETPEDPLVIEIREANEQMTSTIQGYQQEIEVLKNQNDANLTANLSSIQSQFETRKREMAKINANNLSGKKLLGAKSGRTRYAPDMQQDILSLEESNGLGRLHEIDNQMNSAIAAAKQAKADKDWKLLDKQISLATDFYKQKIDSIKDINTIMTQRNTELREKAKDELEKNKWLADYSDMVAKKAAFSLVNIDDNGNITIPTDEELQDYADAYGTDILSLKTYINQQTIDLKNSNLEEKNAALDLIRKQQEIDLAQIELETPPALTKPELRTIGKNFYEIIYNPKTNSYEPHLLISGISGGGGGGGGTTTTTTPDTTGDPVKLSPTAQNVIGGIQDINSLTPTEQQKVLNELRGMGLFDDNPPDWFIKSVEEEYKTSDYPLAKKLWDKEREELIKQIGQEQTTTNTNTISTNDELDFNNL